MRKKKALFFHFLFAAYMLVLLRITVFRSGCFENGWFTGRIEWIPFLYLAFLVRIRYWSYFLYLFVGNLVWFFPFGAYLCWRKKGFWLTVLLSALLSVTIETLQFVFGSGVTEVEDVILNTLGAAMGYGICCFFRWKKGRRQKQKR